MDTHASFSDAAEIERPLELRLEPAAVLPQQLARENLYAVRGERRLMLAVLAEAVGTFRRTAGAESRQDQRLFAETAHWFGSDDGGAPFAFANICDTLGLDAGYIRGGLKRWRSDARRQLM
jgi:hypothetical protein